MMRLILALTLAWTVFSSAGALLCNVCNDTRCSTTLPSLCQSSETSCFTASSSVCSGPTKALQRDKGCIPSILCPTEGSQNFSFQSGFFSAMIDADCCSTDGCNSGGFHTPATPAANGLRCCNDSQCSQPTECRGVADRCFQGKLEGSTAVFSGCMSNNLCEIISSLGTVPFFDNLPVDPGFFCCSTSLCNSGTCSATLGLFPLLLGLLCLL